MTNHIIIRWRQQLWRWMLDHKIKCTLQPAVSLRFWNRLVRKYLLLFLAALPLQHVQNIYKNIIDLPCTSIGFEYMYIVHKAS